MTTTPKIAITHLEAQQASAEVTVNDALNLLDTFANLTVKDRDLTAPPGSPSDGDAYIPAATATGDWAGKEDDVAVYFNGWIFKTPWEGLRMWVEDEDTHFTYDGTNWIEKPSSVTTGISANGTTQGAATQLTSRVNEVTTVAALFNDAVKLPAALKGMEVVVINQDSVDALQVFPASGDDIDGGSTDAAVNVSAGERGIFYAMNSTSWHSLVGVKA